MCLHVRLSADRNGNHFVHRWLWGVLSRRGRQRWGLKQHPLFCFPPLMSRLFQGLNGTKPYMPLGGRVHSNMFSCAPSLSLVCVVDDGVTLCSIKPDARRAGLILYTSHGRTGTSEVTWASWRSWKKASSPHRGFGWGGTTSREWRSETACSMGERTSCGFRSRESPSVVFVGGT